MGGNREYAAHIARRGIEHRRRRSFAGIVRASKTNQLIPKPEALALGAVTNFFDTLGIGSFAPTIAWFRFRKMVPDRLMPLTMFIGYTIPAILQGVIFLILLGVRVDPILLLG
jgi:hypothetical protein